MLDVREILKVLSPEDKIVWEQCRTEMRRCYLSTHNAVVGIAGWDKHDDAFMDLIDIKIATLFNRAGKIEFTGKDVTGQEEAPAIEEQINHTSKINTQRFLNDIMRNGQNESDPWKMPNGNGK